MNPADSISPREWARIEALRARGFRLEDLHVHLKGGLTLDDVLARSASLGLAYGIAVNCGRGFPVESDADALAFCRTVHARGALAGMQAEGREWTHMFTRATAARFDYVFTDAMTWTDDDGRRMRLWIADEVGTIEDVERFMETLVARTVQILNEEPIDVFVNPTYLPDRLQSEAALLWTSERIAAVVEAAARNQVAIELNDLYRLPSDAFIHAARRAGCRFTLGSNNTGPGDLGCAAFGLEAIERCGLEPADFFHPGQGSKAIERKPTVLAASI